MAYTLRLRSDSLSSVCCNRSMSHKLHLHWMSQQALPSARMPFGCTCLPALNFAHGISSWVDRFPLTISPGRGCATGQTQGLSWVCRSRFAPRNGESGPRGQHQGGGKFGSPRSEIGICPFIVPARADCFCSYPSHEGSIARHTTLDSRGDIDLYWSWAFDVAKH